jgi:hypothetical protein
MVFMFRWLILSDESDGHLAVMERKKMRAERLGKSYSLFQVLQFYVFRLLGTGKCCLGFDKLNIFGHLT